MISDQSTTEPESAAAPAAESVPASWAAEAIEAALDAVVVVDADEHVVHVNPAGERLLGYARSEAVGRPLGDLLVAPGPWLLNRRVEARARWRGRHEFAVEVTMAQTSAEPVLFTAFVRELAPVPAPPVSATRAARRVDAAEELAEVGSWEYDLQTGAAHWSDQMYRIAGLEPGETQPSLDLLLSLVHPRDRERVAALLESLTEEPERLPPDGVMLEHRLVRPDGSVRDLRARWRVERDALGRLRHCTGSGQDVTRQRLLERELLAHHAVEQSLREWESFDEGVIGLLRRLGAALEFPIGSMWLWNAEQRRLSSRAFWFSPSMDIGDFKLAVVSRAFRPGEGFAGHVWNTGRPIISTTMCDDALCGDREAVRRIGLQSGIAFPATYDDRPLAVFTYYRFDKEVPTERLLRTLGGIGRELGRFLGRRGDELGSRRLSAREQEVLQLAADGNTGPQIAALLNVSPATVKSHFEHVYEKLGVGDRAAAVAYAMRIGLIR